MAHPFTAEFLQLVFLVFVNRSRENLESDVLGVMIRMGGNG